MTLRVHLLSLLAAVSLNAQVTVTAERISSKPILIPGGKWASAGRFNPAAILVGEKTVLLFRARDGAGTSRIGYAESADGLHFTVRPEPILSPEATYEKGGGVEDPRVVRIEGTYYLTYTSYNLHDAQLCLATSQDLIHWKRRGVIMPAYKGKWNTQWTKSGAIVPWRIHGAWWMYYMGNRRDQAGGTRDYMGVASSPDLLHWADATDQPVLAWRPGAFDARVMEPGPAPILTSAGILLLYNGADEKLVYGPGWILFDSQDPTKVIARSQKPVILPELEWEKTGTVPNVIFLEGAVALSPRNPASPMSASPMPGSPMPASQMDLIGYYGAADKFVGAMKLRITVDPLQPAGLRP